MAVINGARSVDELVRVIVSLVRIPFSHLHKCILDQSRESRFHVCNAGMSATCINHINFIKEDLIDNMDHLPSRFGSCSA